MSGLRDDDGPAPVCLGLRGITKAYVAPVLGGIDLNLAAGEIHALVGANGAGKSTLARVIAGLARPDAGSLSLDGAPYAPPTKAAAEAAGVQIVQQELTVVPTLTVAENLLIGRWPSRAGWIRRRTLRTRAEEVLADFGLARLDPEAPAGTLGVGEQQLLEIAGTLDRPCRVLILDEPTAALTDPQIELLFAHVARLKQRGVAVVYISHRMEELRQIADRVSVLRDGRLIATQPMAGVTTEGLLALMVGESPATTLASEPVPRETGSVALRVEHLRRGARVQDVCLEVRRGEILGLAGLVGAGRTELLRAIYGADRAESGAVYLGDDPRPRRFGHPREAVRAGLGLIPEDRKAEGLLLDRSIRVNTTLARLNAYATRGGWLHLDRERDDCERMGRSLGLKSDGPEQAAWQLSGGNQQKVVLARWMLRDPAVWLLDEPTRGIDLAARGVVHERIRSLAAQGRAIVLVTSDLDELMALSDRIAALSNGRLVATFDDRAAFAHEAILEATFREHLRDRAGSSL
jgi:ribose transport system ATP-binding protein